MKMQFELSRRNYIETWPEPTTETYSIPGPFAKDLDSGEEFFNNLFL